MAASILQESIYKKLTMNKRENLIDTLHGDVSKFQKLLRLCGYEMDVVV